MYNEEELGYITSYLLGDIEESDDPTDYKRKAYKKSKKAFSVLVGLERMIEKKRRNLAEINNNLKIHKHIGNTYSEYLSSQAEYAQGFIKKDENIYDTVLDEFIKLYRTWKDFELGEYSSLSGSLQKQADAIAIVIPWEKAKLYCRGEYFHFKDLDKLGDVFWTACKGGLGLNENKRYRIHKEDLNLGVFIEQPSLANPKACSAFLLGDRDTVITAGHCLHNSSCGSSPTTTNCVKSLAFVFGFSDKNYCKDTNSYKIPAYLVRRAVGTIKGK